MRRLSQIYILLPVISGSLLAATVTVDSVTPASGSTVYAVNGVVTINAHITNVSSVTEYMALSPITYSCTAQCTVGGDPAANFLTPGYAGIGTGGLEPGKSYTGPVFRVSGITGPVNLVSVTLGMGASPFKSDFSAVIIQNVAIALPPSLKMNGIVPLYGTSTTIQPGAWASIYGQGLAPSTAAWNGIFPIPTALNGVSVLVNGKLAYLWFVSDGQVNFQAPDDSATGSVPVVLQNVGGTASSIVNLATSSPSLSLLDAKYPAAIAITADSGNTGNGYDVIGPPGHFTYPTRPIKKGEILVLYGVGFGPTNPSVPAGQAPQGAAPIVSVPIVRIGGASAEVKFAGIIAAGLYQINVVVPANVGTGDQSLEVAVAGLTTQPGILISVQ